MFHIQSQPARISVVQTEHTCQKLTHLWKLLWKISPLQLIKQSQKTKPKPKNKKELVGWKDYVEPHQDAAKFWFSIWTSAGRPINTVLHSIMKKTRNQFHYQIRKCKRVENFIKNKKLVENCLEGENDIFAEIKRQRGNETEESVTIDGAVGGNIPDKFADVYEELFNRENDRENKLG